ADALAVHNIELSLAEGGGDLVLGHADARPVADDLTALLEGLDAPDVEAQAGVELQRPPAARRLRVAEHHADLHAKLVREDHRGVAVLDRTRELAQRLAHQAGLQANVRVAHFALDLGAGHE